VCYHAKLVHNSSSLFWVCRTAKANDCTILHFHQQCIRVPLAPYPCVHLLFSIFFHYSNPSGCEVISHCGLCGSVIKHLPSVHEALGHIPG
jgi:hypothetical protein